jgi:hypothetical protein
MSAGYDTLVILDCCEAGLAAAEVIRIEGAQQEQGGGDDKPENSRGDNPAPRKELIGACGWGNFTRSKMSPAMCNILKEELQPGSSISTFTLVNFMNSDLVEKYKGDRNVSQAVHYMLRDGQRTQDGDRIAGKIILRRLKGQNKEGAKREEKK